MTPPPPPSCPPPPPRPRSPSLLSPSIIPTAFLGTATIFACFSLSALYARRRSFLYLGGERGRRGDTHGSWGLPAWGGGHPTGGPGPGLTPCPLLTGFLLSGLTLMLLSSVVNAFVGSTWLFTVSLLPSARTPQRTDRHQLAVVMPTRDCPSSNIPSPSRRPISTWG